MIVLTDQQREALAYVRDTVRHNPLELCQDSVSKRHAAMVRLAVETIDEMLANVRLSDDRIAHLANNAAKLQRGHSEWEIGARVRVVRSMPGWHAFGEIGVIDAIDHDEHDELSIEVHFDTRCRETGSRNEWFRRDDLELLGMEQDGQ